MRARAAITEFTADVAGGADPFFNVTTRKIAIITTAIIAVIKVIILVLFWELTSGGDMPSIGLL